MSIAQLKSGKFIVIDAVELTPPIKDAINKLTNNGADIEAFLAVHPFHSVYIPPFHALYPKVDYYGCPRHLKRLTNIQWAGNLNDCKIRNKWSPEIEMSIPDGGEFVAPLPENKNHFSSVLVYHKKSRTIHVDDTIMYAPSEKGLTGSLLKIAGYKAGYMTFHLSIKNVGLKPDPKSPFEFRDWVKKIIKEWDFDNICAAHVGNKIGGAKQQLEELLKKSEPMFVKLSELKKKGGNVSLEDEEDEEEKEGIEGKEEDLGTECG